MVERVMLEPGIGEIFELDGDEYKCVSGVACNLCVFDLYKKLCPMVVCSPLKRQDGKSVSFVEVQK